MCSKCSENHKAGISILCQCECHNINYGGHGNSYNLGDNKDE